MSGGARTAASACADRSEAMLRGLAVASQAVASVLSGAGAALATSDTTFGDPLETVEGTVGGTGGRRAAALAVGSGLAGTAIV